MTFHLLAAYLLMKFKRSGSKISELAKRAGLYKIFPKNRPRKVRNAKNYERLPPIDQKSVLCPVTTLQRGPDSRCWQILPSCVFLTLLLMSKVNYNNHIPLRTISYC